MTRRITLLTDFGTADGYAAALRGVIAALSPDAIVDDIAHDIPPGDVRAASWTLRRYWDVYPSGTIHLIVVDPGVGTARRGVAARIHGRFLVAPDNGVLTWPLLREDSDAAVVLDRPAMQRLPVAPTFHGRDVFAPAAGRLARGEALEKLGSAASGLRRFHVPAAHRREGAITGEVLHVDRFGNLITNVPAGWLPEAPAEGLAVKVRGTARPGASALTVISGLSRTYGEASEPGRAVAVIGSDDLLEIAVRDGNAAARLGAGQGTGVEVVSVAPDRTGRSR